MERVKEVRRYYGMTMRVSLMNRCKNYQSMICKKRRRRRLR
jgi:hypothetical protein